MNKKYVRVPVSADLEKEIREAMKQLDADHVTLPYQILALVRQGLSYQRIEVKAYHQAIVECAMEQIQWN